MKKWKKIEDSFTKNKNIQPGCRNGIWHWKMCLAHNEKNEKTNNRRNRTAKSFYSSTKQCHKDQLY